MNTIALRNSINHLLLNKIMLLRYLLRSQPALIRCIVWIESVCIRAGVIYYGRSASQLRGKAGDV